MITRTRQIGEHSVRATAGESFAQRLDDVLGILARHAEDLRDGYTLQFGWGPIILEADGEGMHLTTPDYGADAEHDRTSDLSGALALQSTLLHLPGTTGLTPTEVRFDQEALAERGWEELTELEASRDVSEAPQDSGWFLCSADDREEPFERDEVEAVSLWRLVQRHPVLAQMLALPTDVLTIVVDGEVDQLISLTDDELLYENPDRLRPPDDLEDD